MWLAREIPPTDLRGLAGLVSTRTTRELLPSALPDEWLLALVRDLRKCEVDSGDEDDAFAAGPLLLVTYLACQRSEERAGDGWVPADRQLRMLAVYQRYAERAVVARLLSLPSKTDDDRCLVALDAAIGIGD